MAELIHAFDGAGYKAFAFNYACFDGIDESARSLSDLMGLFNTAGNISSNRMVVVAHSMGGLVARAHIAFEVGARHVQKVISLGTPHNGTLKDARFVRKLLQWGEAVSGLNPKAFATSNKSALQLTGTDSARPTLLERLKAPLPAHAAVEFFSISGGYPKLEFGANPLKNLWANQWLQTHLATPNDGLVSEASSDLSRVHFAACAPACEHHNSYAGYPRTNHSQLISNQSVALTAIKAAA